MVVVLVLVGARARRDVGGARGALGLVLERQRCSMCVKGRTARRTRWRAVIILIFGAAGTLTALRYGTAPDADILVAHDLGESTPLPACLCDGAFIAQDCEIRNAITLIGLLL